MNSIVFIDAEIDHKSKQVLDLGAINTKGDVFHSCSIPDFINFVNGTSYICGHNILKHDLPYLQRATQIDFSTFKCIDTLYLSPLLFPKQPYHALVKDDKLQTEELNNPLNDAIKARDLFYDEVAAFAKIDTELQQIYFALLADKNEFAAFFNFIRFTSQSTNLTLLIKNRFAAVVCENAPIEKLADESPIELAYCLALITTHSRYSVTPPWVAKNYIDVEMVIYLLRNKRCIPGCPYCNRFLDAKAGLKKYFGFDAYRTYGGKPLQEEAVNAALNNKSLLAVFPTGGGKSITFQVPALMSGENVKGLSVVISPLQSLMKDQVDNLEKSNITDAVTINGLLDPIERAKSFERVQNGTASILYISPESLRSKSIEHLLLGRHIVRFVIDEAHCFSSWGQDFRVDYLYIGDFIKQLQQTKNLEENIPVSCFTATAKQKVIQDIKDYFQDKLALTLQTFSTKSARTNLHYKVIPRDNEEEKYNTVRHLIEGKPCPTILYVSRTRRAFQLAERLYNDGYLARAYHGKMDKQEKSANQDAFIRGEVQIMVATSAFGMGVDKKDVGMVIHYDISDSLENYVQEAGRAGRDENITADCYVLYNEEDLSKHFILLNQTKLHIKEIQQIWKAIKDLTRFRSTLSNSAFEIARKAGWDDNVVEIETRVTTAISALEEAGYLKRGQNMPQIFANSILSKNAQEAIEKINVSEHFNERQKQQAARIIKKLFSSKSKKQASDEVAESRIDYISDHLGIVKEEVIQVINLLREEKILADTKDLTAFIKRGDNINHSLDIIKTIGQIENFFVSQIDTHEKTYHIKQLNELAELQGCKDMSAHKLRNIINFWAIKNWIKRKSNDPAKNHLAIIANYPKSVLINKLNKRHALSQFIVKLLYEKSKQNLSPADSGKEQILVEFSVHELKNQYEKASLLFKMDVTIADVEDALFYLSRMDAIKIEGGFLVVYNKLSIERLEKNNKRQYKTEDYSKLKEFYENKVQQIHMVAEYAEKMQRDYHEATQFVEDYFQLNYNSFLRKYFNVERQEEIKRNLSPTKFKQLFGELSPEQLSIIKDKDSLYIGVAAGPGSGKTRVLVHKLASLLLMEDVKHEQLLMVTFSRAAATEFKTKLIELIGNAASFIEIKTFHSYCFDLLGRVGSIEKSETIIQQAVEKIKSHDIEPNRITKTVLVIDEAQDMNQSEFELIQTLMAYNEEMRVIAVGDDDQNIYEFRGSDSKYLEQFMHHQQAVKYELNKNYRSKNNLVVFTNSFVQTIGHRIKQMPIFAHQNENGLVKVVNYTGKHIIGATVQDVLSSDLVGTSCVLTQTNHEALQVAGLLNKEGLAAKIIQTNEGFSLHNLLEIRYFVEQLNFTDDNFVISENTWKNAKRRLWDNYKDSTKIDICINLIKEFASSNPKKKYQSDFDIFIQESTLEDFIRTSGETIFVSTIHKAKGKEFDNVFLMLDGFNPETDEKKRQLYVAMTRAKKNLTIHLNGNYLDDISCDSIVRKFDENQYQETDLLILNLTHKDIWLDYNISRQPLISNLKSGDKLTVSSNGCSNAMGNSIVKFSTSFKERLLTLENKGYQLQDGCINYIVYWQKEDTDMDVKIVLPELKLQKK